MMERDLVKEGFDEARKIVGNAVSYLCRAISSLNNRERIDAFNVMYSIMRIIDDLVDERKNNNEKTIKDIREKVSVWREVINKCYLNIPEKFPLSLAFYESLSKFRVPRKIWDDFFNSMEMDLRGLNLKDFPEFEKYCIGATCAPTIIYLFIILSEKKNDIYELNDFDYFEVGHNLGIWAYMIHILRDVKKDVDSGLFYLPEEELAKFNLGKEDIINFSKQGIGDLRYRNFSNYYLDKASTYYRNSIDCTEKRIKRIPKDRGFSILIILRVYKEIENRLKLRGERVFLGEGIITRKYYTEVTKKVAKELKL